MHLNFISSVSTLGTAPSLQTLPLQPGQVLPASLLTADDGKSNLLLQGRIYTATGALPAEPGAFWVQVQKVEQEKIEIKVLSALCGQDLDIKLLGKALNVKVNKETQAVIKHLLRWRLPLSRELVQGFITSTNNVPTDSRPAVWASLAFIKSLALNKEPQKVSAALKYILRHPKAAPEGQEAINQTHPLYLDQEVVRALVFQAGQNEGEVFIVSRYQGQESHHENNQIRSLMIRLSTALWGQIWIQLTINGNELTAKVVAENTSFLSLAQEAEPELKKRFRVIGWELAAITTSKQKITSVAELMEPRGPDNYRPLDALV
ncbi:MAG: flagellar hook-length control protein FliK [bacterium]|jgi:hypothetical protein